MVSRAERIARAALSGVAEPGSKTVMQRVVAVGAEATWQAIRRHDSKLDKSGRLRRFSERVDGADLLKASRAKGIRFVCPGDPDWPEQLDDMVHTLDVSEPVPPALGLWVRGSASLEAVTQQAVTIVGSRAATRYGERVSADLAADLALLGWTVSSGAAYGIDAAAHRGTLALGGVTVAVLACGADVVYPRPHRELLTRIADEGLVLSELPLGYTPTRSRFLARNRILAALTGGTVVVEAAKRSGARSTARWARLLSRHVMAVPGPVTSAMSEGCHQMVRNEGDSLVTTAAEIVDVVGTMGDDAMPLSRGNSRLLDDVSGRAYEVFEAMPAGRAMSCAQLADVTGLGESAVIEALAELAKASLVSEGLDGWRIDLTTARRSA